MHRNPSSCRSCPPRARKTPRCTPHTPATQTGFAASPATRSPHPPPCLRWSTVEVSQTYLGHHSSWQDRSATTSPHPLTQTAHACHQVKTARPTHPPSRTLPVAPSHLPSAPPRDGSPS